MAIMVSCLFSAGLSKYEENIYKNNLNQLEILKKELKNEKDQLIIARKVNNFFNKFPYKSDIKQYSHKEYWASPKEFLLNNGGDCEDYVLAKYELLKELGFKKQYLLFKYIGKIYHVELVVKIDKYFLVLDSYNKRLRKLKKGEIKGSRIVKKPQKLIDLYYTYSETLRKRGKKKALNS